MRRFRTLLLGGLMVVALLIGTGGSAAAARPSVPGVSGATGWLCTPHGSGGGTPTTTISSALINESNMSRSTITCFFPNIVQTGSLIGSGLLPSHLELGGNCYYNAGMSFGVQFRNRIYTVRGTTAQLICWDGFFECMDAVASPNASQCEASTGATTRRFRV